MEVSTVEDDVWNFLYFFFEPVCLPLDVFGSSL